MKEKKWLVRPKQVSGTILVPSSKSHSIRAVLYAALAEGESRIEGLLDSPDVVCAMAAARAIGATVDHGSIQGVAGRLQTPEGPINAGNSGIVLRFMGALGALCHGLVAVTGDVSIRTRRPVTPLISGLNQLGAEARRSNPIEVCGLATAGFCRIDGNDSQPVSALLTLASLLPGTTSIVVDNAKERPWLDLTCRWLRWLGVSVENRNYQTFTVKGRSHWDAFSYRVPGDFSSAAFPVAAALVTQSSLRISGLDFADLQGDRKLFELLGSMVEQQGPALAVNGAPFSLGEVDMDPFIDALPILAVLGCYAKRPTLLKNAQGARNKECDRIAVMNSELRKMGARIDEEGSGLRIYPSKLTGARVRCHADHRVAMALAVAGLGADGDTVVEGVDCVAKTYPTFARDMELCVI